MSGDGGTRITDQVVRTREEILEGLHELHQGFVDLPAETASDYDARDASILSRAIAFLEAIPETSILWDAGYKFGLMQAQGEFRTAALDSGAISLTATQAVDRLVELRRKARFVAGGIAPASAWTGADVIEPEIDA